MSRIADYIVQNIPLPTLPSHFLTYQRGRTPLSTWAPVNSALAAYLLVVFGLRELRKQQQPLKLTFLFRLHNIVLSIGSLILLILMAEEVFPIWWKHGLFHAMCHKKAWTPRLEFYYIINYYFKYVELLDTVFLALKKKPLTFLHVFHHSATALLCYTQLNGKTSTSWVPIVLNLTVHVIMYYYYYATAGGKRIWWKKYLTSLQITQFVLDMFALWFGAYAHCATKYLPSLPTPGDCAWESGSAATFGVVLITSYLFLFINFYIKTYSTGTKGKSSSINLNGNGHAKINGKAE